MIFLSEKDFSILFYRLKLGIAQSMLNPFRYGLSDQRLGMGGGLKGPPRYMAVLEPNKAYICLKVFQGVYQWPSRRKFLIIFSKLTELLAFSYGDNIFKKKGKKNPFKHKIFITRPKIKIFSSGFCKHPIFDSKKKVFNKDWVL